MRPLPQVIQPVDRHAIGRLAQTGPLARSGAGFDERRNCREGRGALPGGLHNGLPVAASVPCRPQSRPSRRLQGIVEADETFILESFKGKRSGLPRASRKRGGKAGKRGLSAEQIPIIVARDRTGATTDAVLPRLDAASITVALGKVIDPAAHFCCDGGTAITAFARRAKVKLHVLPAPGIPRPEAPELHINNVNAYHGRFKEWMRRFHGVATRNLPNYLSWRRTIEALGDASTPEAWIKAAAGLGPYQQHSQ